MLKAINGEKTLTETIPSYGGFITFEDYYGLNRHAEFYLLTIE
jgi:hypothetical protein